MSAWWISFFWGSDVLYRFYISDSLEDEIAESKYIYPMLLDMVNVDRCINLIELLILIELEID
jgi:hypothetical protein